jgi:hypothetical protein
MSDRYAGASATGDCGSPGPGADFPTGMQSDGTEGGADPAGLPGGGSDVMPTADSSTANQPRPEDFM